MTERGLGWALEVSKDPFRQDPETLVMAMGVLRHWRTEFKSEMRGLPRSSEKYKELKKQEERLEGALITNHEAWMTQLSSRKHGG